MEITGRGSESPRRKNRQGQSNALVFGTILIIVGLVVLGYNHGLIDRYVYRIIISWPMMLVAVGAIMLSQRNISGGLIFAAIGAFFLIPRVTGAGPEWFQMYKPLLIIFLGVLIVMKVALKPSAPRKRGYKEATMRTSGYVVAENVMGSYKNIVLDEEFKGARIMGTMSGTVLDLRHTSIAPGETYIDINTTMSGIELYVPSQWEVESELKVFLGGLEDKRYVSGTQQLTDRKIVLRGNVTLGGIEIKN